ncbi:hypothetical protein QE152_g9355 [Popillia japonica]|uniref:Uncharacterized protein n=1 Tax=Popillia japonica TaxID=7064 RepID=A0AAW1LZN0_POPJA
MSPSPQPLQHGVPINNDKKRSITKLLQKHGKEWQKEDSLVFFKEAFQTVVESQQDTEEESNCEEEVFDCYLAPLGYFAPEVRKYYCHVVRSRTNQTDRFLCIEPVYTVYKNCCENENKQYLEKMLLCIKTSSVQQNWVNFAPNLG